MSEELLTSYYGFDSNFMLDYDKYLAYEDDVAGDLVYHDLISSGLLVMPEDFQKICEEVGVKDRYLMEKVLALYNFPADDWTDEDFKTQLTKDLPYLEGLHKEEDIRYKTFHSYRTLKVLNKSIEDKLYPNDLYWAEVIEKFFFPNHGNRNTPLGRFETPFRLIELNEFLEHREYKETFEHFLRGNEEVKEKCRNLEYTFYSKRSKEILNQSADHPLAMKRKISKKLKEIILNFTADDFAKIYSHSTDNKYLFTGVETNSSLRYVFDLILNEGTALKDSSTRDLFLTQVLSNFESFTNYITKEGDNLASFSMFESMALRIKTLTKNYLPELFEKISETESFKSITFPQWEEIANIVKYRSRESYILDQSVLLYNIIDGNITSEAAMRLILELSKRDLNIDHKFEDEEDLSGYSDLDIPMHWLVSVNLKESLDY